MWEQLIKKGYEITNKRVLGNPTYTSEQTRHKDLVQELALVQDWLRKYGIEIYFRPERNARTSVVTYYYGISKICSTNHLEIIEVVDLMNSNYPTPTEAKIAAIEYTINNLI